jgi:hypothetical protein
MFCLLRAFSAMVGTAAAGAPAASAMSHDLTHPRMSWANIHFFLLSLVTLSVALHSDTNTAVFSVDTHHGSFADNGSCALLFNTKIERERERDVYFNYRVSPLVVRFTTTYCFAGPKKEMDGHRQNFFFCIFVHSFFFLSYRRWLMDRSDTSV